MSVFVDKESKVIVQGFTGQHATFHAEESMRFGTRSFNPCELTVRQKSTGSPPAPTSSSSTLATALA